MLKSFNLIDDPFVALEIELDKAVFPFKVVFMVTINMLSSIAHINVIKSKND